MIKYYTWALSEKVLSILPLGTKLYYFAGSLLTKNKKGKNASFLSSLILVKKVKDLVPPNSTILDVGTGWFHHESFLLWLSGNYKIILFDIRNNSKLIYIKNYIHHIIENLDYLSEQLHLDKTESERKLSEILKMNNKEDIYTYCNFEPHITQNLDTLSIYNNSINFMISNCVLNHIPLKMLDSELGILKKLLNPGGMMYFLIGHDDHWSFHDNTANIFNYYRYSDKFYKILFENKFEFQNRLVKPELDELFKKNGLEVIEYFPYITTESKNAVKTLGKINSRFSKYPSSELSAIWSFYLLK